MLHEMNYFYGSYTEKASQMCKHWMTQKSIAVRRCDINKVINNIKGKKGAKSRKAYAYVN